MLTLPSSNPRRKFLRQSASAAAAVAATGALTNKTLAQAEPGIEGYKAPELEVDYWIDADGKPTSAFSVHDAKGKWVFLKCFQNWCPGCHKHGFPTLKAFCDRFQGHPKVAIAGIQTVFEGYSTNTKDAVRELQLRYDLPIPMGHDPGNPETDTFSSTMVNYRTGGTPWIILINPEGAVVYNHFQVNTEALIAHIAEQVG